MRNLNEKTEQARDEIFELNRSEDPQLRTLAITRAAAMPPERDPRLAELSVLLLQINRILKCTNEPELKGLLPEAYDNAQQVYQTLGQEYEATRKTSDEWQETSQNHSRDDA